MGKYAPLAVSPKVEEEAAGPDVVPRDWRGFRLSIPPENVRDHPDWAATIRLWVLRMPRIAPAWSHYVCAGITLADLPGVKPAVKDAPWQTHEVIVYAVNPHEDVPGDEPGSKGWRELDEGEILSGKLLALSPTNHTVRFSATDAVCASVVDSCARAFLGGRQVIEPQGVQVNGISAKEYFKGFVVAEAARLNSPAGGGVDLPGTADAKTSSG